MSDHGGHADSGNSSSLPPRDAEPLERRAHACAGSRGEDQASVVEVVGAHCRPGQILGRPCSTPAISGHTGSRGARQHPNRVVGLDDLNGEIALRALLQYISLRVTGDQRAAQRDRGRSRSPQLPRTGRPARRVHRHSDHELGEEPERRQGTARGALPARPGHHAGPGLPGEPDPGHDRPRSPRLSAWRSLALPEAAGDRFVRGVVLIRRRTRAVRGAPARGSGHRAAGWLTAARRRPDRVHQVAGRTVHRPARARTRTDAGGSTLLGRSAGGVDSLQLPRLHDRAWPP